VALPALVMVIALGPGWLLLSMVLGLTALALSELAGMLLSGSRAWFPWPARQLPYLW
jgi:hypothetical protein